MYLLYLNHPLINIYLSDYIGFFSDRSDLKDQIPSWLCYFIFVYMYSVCFDVFTVAVKDVNQTYASLWSYTTQNVKKGIIYQGWQMWVRCMPKLYLRSNPVANTVEITLFKLWVVFKHNVISIVLPGRKCHVKE